MIITVLPFITDILTAINIMAVILSASARDSEDKSDQKSAGI